MRGRREAGNTPPPPQHTHTCQVRAIAAQRSQGSVEFTTWRRRFPPTPFPRAPSFAPRLFSSSGRDRTVREGSLLLSGAACPLLSLLVFAWRLNGRRVTGLSLPSGSGEGKRLRRAELARGTGPCQPQAFNCCHFVTSSITSYSTRNNRLITLMTRSRLCLDLPMCVMATLSSPAGGPPDRNEDGWTWKGSLRDMLAAAPGPGWRALTPGCPASTAPDPSGGHDPARRPRPFQSLQTWGSRGRGRSRKNKPSEGPTEPQPPGVRGQQRCPPTWEKGLDAPWGSGLRCVSRGLGPAHDRP